MWDQATGKDVSLGTFRSKADADRRIALAQADQTRGAWVDPRRGHITLGAYTLKWLAERPKLRRRTRDGYGSLFKCHIEPTLGDIEIGKLSPSVVRSWNSALVRSKPRESLTPAKAYRLLHVVCATAVDDEIILRNPCTIKDAGKEHSPERLTASVAQVWRLADEMPARFRLLVLLAAFLGLRLGELQGLRCQDVDPLHRRLSVRRQIQQLADGTLEVGPPKTDAGLRTISLPQFLLPEIERHFAQFTAGTPSALVFSEADGCPFNRMKLYRAFWPAAKRAELPSPFTIHDLRHTGNTLTAAAGASTKELMARNGHASAEAALRYQHATEDRDRVIAELLNEYVTKAKDLPPDEKANGTE